MIHYRDTAHAHLPTCNSASLCFPCFFSQYFYQVGDSSLAGGLALSDVLSFFSAPAVSPFTDTEFLLFGDMVQIHTRGTSRMSNSMTARMLAFSWWRATCRWQAAVPPASLTPVLGDVVCVQGVQGSGGWIFEDPADGSTNSSLALNLDVSQHVIGGNRSAAVFHIGQPTPEHTTSSMCSLGHARRPSSSMCALCSLLCSAFMLFSVSAPPRCPLSPFPLLR